MLSKIRDMLVLPLAVSPPGTASHSSRIPQSRACLVVLAALFVAFLEITDVMLALVGGLAYVFLQKGLKGTQATKTRKICDDGAFVKGGGEKKQRVTQVLELPNEQDSLSHRSRTKADLRQPSVVPVVCPVFATSDWDGQVSELLQMLTSTEETASHARSTAVLVADLLRSAFPDVEVTSFAHGNPKCNKAFATAVPDVEIVANIDNRDIVRWLGSELDAKCLQKAAIRSCTDLLTSGDFKFRRSAFKFDEPKVTLVAPASVGSLAFDFSVNAATPLHHDTLLRECAKVDSRVKELILIVHRWARDRGIFHAAKGNMTPYAWSLVVIFFLQVRDAQEGALISAMKPSAPCFQPKRVAKERTGVAKSSVASLLVEFMHFYATDFEWCGEVLSVTCGCRSARSATLDWRRQVSPQINDPFNSTSNLGKSLTSVGLARLREEFDRACKICAGTDMLSRLLEPWAPPESYDAEGDDTSAERQNLKSCVPGKSSLGSLSAAPSASLRPSYQAPKPSLRGSLTASTAELSLRPSNALKNKVALTSSIPATLGPG